MNPGGGRQAYFCRKELAVKKQSFKMCEHPHHVRENEMGLLATVLMKKEDCQLSRDYTVYV